MNGNLQTTNPIYALIPCIPVQMYGDVFVTHLPNEVYEEVFTGFGVAGI